MLGGGSRYTAQVMLLGRLFSMLSSKKMGILFYKPNKNLDLLVELIEAGKVTPAIDRTFPLNETADAFRYYGTGQFCGKIVITV
jgi:NADPH:quinone reductase-like Zn-dependent oxidoreductase